MDYSRTFSKVAFPGLFLPCKKFFPNLKFLKKEDFPDSVKYLDLVFPLIEGYVGEISFVEVSDPSAGDSHILFRVFKMERDYLPVVGMRIQSLSEVAELVLHLRLTSNQINEILRIQIVLIFFLHLID